MKNKSRIEQLSLKKREKKALLELKKQLRERCLDTEIVLYGSKARGDYGEFSDIDLLILINSEVDDSCRGEIFSISFEIELEYDVVFGILVESKDFWASDLAQTMPIHWNIDKEGMTVI